METLLLNKELSAARAILSVLAERGSRPSDEEYAELMALLSQRSNIGGVVVVLESALRYGEMHTDLSAGESVSYSLPSLSSAELDAKYIMNLDDVDTETTNTETVAGEEEGDIKCNEEEERVEEEEEGGEGEGEGEDGLSIPHSSLVPPGWAYNLGIRQIMLAIPTKEAHQSAKRLYPWEIIPRKINVALYADLSHMLFRHLLCDATVPIRANMITDLLSVCAISSIPKLQLLDDVQSYLLTVLLSEPEDLERDMIPPFASNVDLQAVEGLIELLIETRLAMHGNIQSFDAESVMGHIDGAPVSAKETITANILIENGVLVSSRLGESLLELHENQNPSAYFHHRSPLRPSSSTSRSEEPRSQYDTVKATEANTSAVVQLLDFVDDSRFRSCSGVVKSLLHVFTEMNCVDEAARAWKLMNHCGSFDLPESFSKKRNVIRIFRAAVSSRAVADPTSIDEEIVDDDKSGERDTTSTRRRHGRESVFQTNTEVEEGDRDVSPVLVEANEATLNEQTSRVLSKSLGVHRPRLEAFFSNMKVVQLKEELRKRDLKVSGLKAQLVERLIEHDTSQWPMWKDDPDHL